MVRRVTKAGPQADRLVFPGAAKHVTSLAAKFLAEEPGFGLLAILTQSALIVGKPAESSFLDEVTEKADEFFGKVFEEQGLKPPLTGGRLCLQKAQVRPFAALNSTINFDELAVFSEDIVAIAPGTSVTRSLEPVG
jgi:hypothetical protein